MTWLKTTLTLTTATLLLSACSSVLFNGASVIYKQNHLYHTIRNINLDQQAEVALKRDKKLYPYNINVSVMDYHVLLLGQVPSQSLKAHATTIIKDLPHIQRVINRIEIKPQISKSTMVHDTWLTTKIKSKIIADKRVDLEGIKIVTEDRTVYLFGVATEEQAKVTIAIARSTQGVKKVVNLLRYIRLTTHPNE